MVLCLLLALVAGACGRQPQEPPAPEPDGKPAPAKADGEVREDEPVRNVTEQGYRVQLDLSTQMLRLAVPEPREEWRDSETLRPGDCVVVQADGVALEMDDRIVARLSKDQRLHVVEVRDRVALTATRVAGEVRRGWVAREAVAVVGHEDGVQPTLSRIAVNRFVSHSVLAQKAKQFEDGLYAAADLAAQTGAGRFAGKRHLLASVVRNLAESEEGELGNVPGIVFGAGQLGDLDITVPARWQQAARAEVDTFLSRELRSKPISFYTWSKELRAIFRQDRMLQTELKGKAGIEALVKAIGADERAENTYRQYLALVSKLTNPLAYPDLREQLAALKRGVLDPPSSDIHFFPPSVSHETELVKKLYGGRPIPEGFSLIDELIRRIRAGKIDLTPTAESGWYDYQTWAQEPLVLPDKMPEAKHLELNDVYREQLIELFKGVLALARETHIKQLENPPVGEEAELPPDFGEPPKPKVHIHISPELSAEPLATFYRRRAISYRFIRTVLEKTFGAESIGQMRRLTAAGPVKQDLASELEEMEAVFYGAYVTVCRQLGMPLERSSSAGTSAGADSDAARFLAWRDRLSSDPDIGQDVRMMVPVFYDVLREKTKVWVFLGWQPQQVKISFAKRPTTVVLDPAGKPVTDDRVVLHYDSTHHTLAYPVTAEVYVNKILNREEFRRHCDTYKTRSAILDNLE